MKQTLLFLTLFVLAGLSFGTEQTGAADASENVGLNESQIQAMEQRLTTITDPAAKLFFKANIERAKGQPELALQTLAQLIVHHAHAEKWIARSELMSAELYLELGMLDAADVTARQVQQLYVGMDVKKQADALRSEIKKLKESAE